MVSEEASYVTFLNRIKETMRKRRYRSKKKGLVPNSSIPKSAIQAFKIMTNKQLIELSRAALNEVEERIENYKRKTTNVKSK